MRVPNAILRGAKNRDGCPGPECHEKREVTMQRYNLWARILALGVAGAGWYLFQGAWVCERDPYGLFTAVFGPDVNLASIASCLRYGWETCLFLALLLVTGVDLAEATIRVPLARSVTQSQEPSPLSPSLSGI